MAPRIKVTITDRDRGWKELGRRLKAAAGKTMARAGFLEKKSARDGEDLTNAELALVHEFGSPEHKIPQRAFIRPSFDQQLPANSVLLEQLGRRLLDGKVSLSQVLGAMGAKLASDIKKFITAGSGVPPPNAPATLARKLAKGRKGSTGEPRTLVDTGQLVGSVTWDVEHEDAR